jgi:hypothetical protein
MKKIIYILLIMFFFIQTTLYSQIYYQTQSSSLHPVLVVWSANGTKISLRKGLYGINQPNELRLNVYFTSAQVKKLAEKGAKLEFRWFYYLSTRRKFVQSDIKSFAQARRVRGGGYVLSSALSVLQPGWWEVQVISSTDHRPISFAGKNRFQILLKRSYYANR